MKRFGWILMLFIVFGLGVWIGVNYFLNRGPSETSSSDSTVLIEKVNQVCKLVTVEGIFHERYDETNIKEFNLYLVPRAWQKFSKKATLIVSGKVLVGYDMDRIEITADSTTKTIYLSNMPQPEILAIDHEVRYENLDESWFNTFEEKDFTLLNQNAKQVLREKAVNEQLMEKAIEQGNQVIDVVRFMAESVGWNVQLGTYIPPPPAADQMLND